VNAKNIEIKYDLKGREKWMSSNTSIIIFPCPRRTAPP